MFKYALALALLAAAAQAKFRVQRLPAGLMAKEQFRYPLYEDDSKIVGGSEVTPNSIPFQISFQDVGSNFHFCGGEIYDETHVITAAHCCRGSTPNSVQVVAGEHNLFETEGNEQTVGVSAITIHEDYNPYSNDICLLTLESALEFNDAVGAVGMAAQGEEFLSGDAVVSGWGTLSAGGSSPDVLYSVTVPIVSDDDCAAAYGSDFVAETMICSGEAGKDSCQGDSGGPMTCQSGGNTVLCGIVSWGYSCAAPGFPGVYAEAAQYVDWVQDNL